MNFVRFPFTHNKATKVTKNAKIQKKVIGSYNKMYKMLNLLGKT